jgi:TrmH family RNA methyltransferase
MPTTITSPHNPRVKQATRLRDRRGREKQGRIIIDGAREIGQALAGGVGLVEIFLCKELLRGEESRSIAERLERAQAGVEVLHVTPEVFEKIAYGDRSDGLVAVAGTPDRSLDAMTLPPLPLIAVLEGVEKPGNVGAVARSADAAGVSALIAADEGTDLFNPNAVRASLGALFTLPVAAAPAGEVLAWLRGLKTAEGRAVAIFSARVDGAIEYTAADFRGPAAVVLGSEDAGLTDVWRGDDVTSIRLPMRGRVDSLNVSAAAAVLFYEAVRQRA